MARRVVGVYSWKNRGTPYVRALAVSWRICSVSAAYASAHTHTHIYISLGIYTCTYVHVPAAARENHGKAKNTFRINCRVGIPRRCAEQNAAVACKTKRRREKKGNRGWSVDRSVQTGVRQRVRSVSRKNANFSLRRRCRAREELLVSLRDPMLSLRLRYVQKVEGGL